MNIIDKLSEKYVDGGRFDGVTSGVVVDVKDPQEMGRIRVICPVLGDDPNEPDLENIPWCSFNSPYAGVIQDDEYRRGTDEHTTGGAMSYGMWSIPKTGSTVTVMCIDGNPLYRIWTGCLYAQNTPHTMPHGRYVVDGEELVGPLSSNNDNRIEPLNANLREAFNGRDDVSGASSFEYMSRGSDYSVAGVSNDWLQYSGISNRLPDDVGGNKKVIADKIYQQGYATNPKLSHETEIRDANSKGESSVWCITTPGFHSFSMDDRPDNTRIRLRTTAGHQILLDDTNERIYIATAKGNNWLEMDAAGNVDVYSQRRVSIHSAKDMNFSTEESFRVTAKKGIHLSAGEDVRISAEGGVELSALNDIKVNSSGGVVALEGSSELNLTSSGNINVDGGGVDIKSSANVAIDGGGNVGVKSGGNVIISGTMIHLNGPPALTAGSGSVIGSDAVDAFVTNRIPLHEPWPRRMLMLSDTDTLPANMQPLALFNNLLDDSLYEFGYTDKNINTVELGDMISRGKFWQR